MKLKKSLVAILIASGALVSSQTLLAAPAGTLDGPVEGEVITGLVNIWGWAGDTTPISKVEFRVDNNAFKRLGYGGTRGDVANSHPEYYNSEHTGFAGAFHTKYMSNGPHTVTVRFTNSNGQTTEITNNVVVSNTPDAQNVNWNSVDLTGATARISGNTVFLDNMSINGTPYNNVDLSFNQQANAFQITRFASDLNHDGYYDDDHDRDGYHDDDQDRDGYHDNDYDRDGWHDNDNDRDGFRDDDYDRDGFGDNDDNYGGNNGFNDDYNGGNTGTCGTTTNTGSIGNPMIGDGNDLGLGGTGTVIGGQTNCNTTGGGYYDDDDRYGNDFDDGNDRW